MEGEAGGEGQEGEISSQFEILCAITFNVYSNFPNTSFSRFLRNKKLGEFNKVLPSRVTFSYFSSSSQAPLVYICV